MDQYLLLVDEDEGSPLQNGVNRHEPGKSRDQRMPSKPFRFALSFKNKIDEDRQWMVFCSMYICCHWRMLCAE